MYVLVTFILSTLLDCNSDFEIILEALHHTEETLVRAQRHRLDAAKFTMFSQLCNAPDLLTVTFIKLNTLLSTVHLDQENSFLDLL